MRRPPTFGGFQAVERTVWPFGEAQTATSSSWALAPAPQLFQHMHDGPLPWEPVACGGKGCPAERHDSFDARANESCKPSLP
eukprot:2849078-Alexandrium_andersonii.AAC.1